MTNITKTELLLRLRELHEELSRINIDLEPGEQVDDATIDALGELVTDVSNLVDQAKSTAHDEQIEDHGKPLLDRIIEFEQAHPRVGSFLSQMTDMLAMMGL